MVDVFGSMCMAGGIGRRITSSYVVRGLYYSCNAQVLGARLVVFDAGQIFFAEDLEQELSKEHTRDIIVHSVVFRVNLSTPLVLPPLRARGGPGFGSRRTGLANGVVGASPAGPVWLPQSVFAVMLSRFARQPAQHVFEAGFRASSSVRCFGAMRHHFPQHDTGRSRDPPTVGVTAPLEARSMV